MIKEMSILFFISAPFFSNLIVQNAILEMATLSSESYKRLDSQIAGIAFQTWTFFTISCGS